MPPTDAVRDLAPPARRRDATENKLRILAVATDVLAERPNATIDDIAKAAGLVRRTVYGHFANREALIEALAETSIADLLAVMSDARSAGTGPAEAYALFVMGAWRAAERNRRLLTIGRIQLGVEGVVTLMRPVNLQVAELVAAAQADGTFADHLPPAVLAGILQATNFALLDAVNAGRFDGTARDIAEATLLAAGMDRRKALRMIARLEPRT